VGCAAPDATAYVVGVLLGASAAVLGLRGRLWLAVRPAMTIPIVERTGGQVVRYTVDRT